MNEQNPDITFIANREVRAVPQGWRHPTDEHDTFIPLLPYGYAGDDSEIRVTPETTMPPTPWQGETEIIAYETTTEGTPISPAFPNTPAGRLALVNYCVEHATTFGRHRADGEAWAAVLFGCATVDLDGTVHAG